MLSYNELVIWRIVKATLASTAAQTDNEPAYLIYELLESMFASVAETLASTQRVVPALNSRDFEHP